MQELRMLVAAAQENILRRMQREASASSFLMDWASSFDASIGMLEKGGYDGFDSFAAARRRHKAGFSCGENAVEQPVVDWHGRRNSGGRQRKAAQRRRFLSFQAPFQGAIGFGA